MSRTIQLTQGKTALVSDHDYDCFNQRNWSACKTGKSWYAVTWIKGKVVRMHRMVMNAPAGMEVDHINGNGLDNRRENLRLCTRSENGRNRKIGSDNTTGYKGVYRSGKKYYGLITVNNVQKYTGTFSDPIEAAHAYDTLAREYHGPYARLNFPEGAL